MTHFCRRALWIHVWLGHLKAGVQILGGTVRGRTDSHPTHTQCSAQACMHRAKKVTHSRDIMGNLKTSIAECVTYSPCSTDGSSLDTTEESDLVGCWTRAHEVPATQGQQQESKRHSTQQAAKDGNCHQHCQIGACFHLAFLHAAFDRFATRQQQQQLQLAQSHGFSSVELRESTPWNTCAATFSASTVILIRVKDHHNRSSKTTEHEHKCRAGCMRADE